MFGLILLEKEKNPWMLLLCMDCGGCILVYMEFFVLATIKETTIVGTMGKFSRLSKRHGYQYSDKLNFGLLAMCIRLVCRQMWFLNSIGCSYKLSQSNITSISLGIGCIYPHFISFA